MVGPDFPSASIAQNITESLVALDKENKHVPGLAQDWRWLSDRTIEFKLRRGVIFHNGEKFNAQSVKINWEAYRSMENPRAVKLTELPKDTQLEIIDEFRVRFTLPKPDGLVLVKFWFFYQIAPSCFENDAFLEKQGDT